MNRVKRTEWLWPPPSPPLMEKNTNDECFTANTLVDISFWLVQKLFYNFFKYFNVRIFARLALAPCVCVTMCRVSFSFAAINFPPSERTTDEQSLAARAKVRARERERERKKCRSHRERGKGREKRRSKLLFFISCEASKSFVLDYYYFPLALALSPSARLSHPKQEDFQKLFSYMWNVTHCASHSDKAHP